jgi:hypothetical protein
VALWCQRNDQGAFIVFNNLRIAKHVGDVWETVEPGWKVSPIGSLEICVQRNDSDGVIVSRLAAAGV